MPGHAAGLLPLQARGVKFCNAPGVSAIPNWCTLAGDNGSAAQRLLPPLVAEMAALFNSEFYHIGGDESRCSGAGDFERHIIGTVESGGRRAVAWSEVGGKGQPGDGAATPSTVIQAWRSPNASSLAALGAFAAIESSPYRFYLSGGGFSCTTKRCNTKQWVDLWQNSNLSEADPRRKLLLGGSVAMWTDQYCYINDCVRPGDGHAAPAVMWNRTKDKQFGLSVSGMIWPRGHLAAGSFWNWVPGLNITTLNATVLSRHNSMIMARGGLVCPTGCGCTPLAACGVNYVPVAPSPPGPPPGPPPPPPTPHPPPAPSPHTTCNFTSDVNLGRPGKKVGHASKVQSEQECCDACGQDERCQAAHIDAGGTGTCWLWSSFDPRSGNGTACVPVAKSGN